MTEQPALVSYAVPALTLLALAAAFAGSGRLPDAHRRPARFVLAFLLLRFLLIGNPIAWEVYNRQLTPYDIGWRQHDALRLKRQQYLRTPDSVRYLAVGSSQTGVIYDAIARERTDVAMLSVAAMQPLDFLLYRDYIDSYHAQRILLYLSDFDLARRPSPEAMVLAPPQRLRLAQLRARLNRLPERKAYETTLAGMLAGELFPEYRYRFVFRGLADRAARRVAAAFGRERDAGRRERASTEQMIEWARQSMAAEFISFNLTLLEDYLHHAVARGADVIIVEGHYNPAVSTPDIERSSVVVRAELERLADALPGVTYLPRTDVLEFTEVDYTDLSHVNADAAYRFASRIIDLLDNGISSLGAPRQ